MPYSLQKLIRITVLVAVISSLSVQSAHSFISCELSVSGSQTEVRFGSSGSRIFSEAPTLQERDIFILVNYERKKRGLRELKWDPKLYTLARYYSSKMASEDFFDHHDSQGKTVVERAADFKIKGWLKIGENLFYSEGYIAPVGEAVNSWLDSPGHRLNMLDDDWTHSAIGVRETRGLKTYITQVFLEK